MARITRRRAMATGAAVVGLTASGRRAAAEEPKPQKLWTLEGELKVHPKFYYRYYLTFRGQTCALYGADHGHDPNQLSKLQLPARIRVRGSLGTVYHDGGTKENPSALVACWVLYMDVHEVEVLK